MKGYIHSTDTFGTVDGPGIRYVVFFQGCPLRCVYCHNPDTWEFRKGKEVTVDELLHEYDSCKEFLKSGGITATGGEPLAQPDFLLELFKSAKVRNIHTCLDTSGAVFNPDETDIIDEILRFTDLVMLDIKHMDSDKHKQLTGIGNENILRFAEHLRDLKIPVWIRRVVVPGIADDTEELFRLGEFLSTLSNLKALDVLPYHDMARKKYEELGMKYPLPHTSPLSKEDAVKARDIIMSGLKSGLKTL
ncbi:MAG: pyruvate formate lyase-activating protein [Ruminococcus sp.]|nr:pyruvate formate lyase-activating protein [Ruminococcus sp.]